MDDAVRRVTKGQDTIKRFRYQLGWVLLEWLALPDDAVVISELDEDAELLEATRGHESVQIKTRDVGSWTISDVTSKDTPVLQRFAAKFGLEPSTTFRFVSNAGAAQDLARLIKRNAAEATRVAKKLGLGEAEPFLNAIHWDLPHAHPDDMPRRAKEAIARIAQQIHRVILDQEQLEQLHATLLGIVFERSSSDFVGDRTLTPDLLKFEFQRATRQLPVPDGIVLSHLAQAVTSMAVAAVETKTDVVGLSDDERSQLKDVQDKLRTEHYLEKRILAEDRITYSRLLERDGRPDTALAQYALALNESEADNEALCLVMSAASGFLARNFPRSELLMPYLDRYVEAALASRSIRWVESASVVAMQQAVHQPADYIELILGRVAEKLSSELDAIDRLHGLEAIGLLHTFKGNVAQAIGAFRTLLSEVDAVETYDQDRLHDFLIVIEPSLSGDDAFEQLFAEFSAFYERKQAWGSKANLYKTRAVALFNRSEYEKAIDYLNVASEGYARVAATRGYLLSKSIVALCYQNMDRSLAAVKHWLGTALLSDQHAVRDLSLDAVYHAAALANNSDLLLDAFAWSLGYSRMAGVLVDRAHGDRAFKLIVHIFGQLNCRRHRGSSDKARLLLGRYLSDSETLADFDTMLEAAYGSDEEWESALGREQDAEVVAALKALRSTIATRCGEKTGEPTSFVLDRESFCLVGDWSAQPELKWVVLGLMSWFDEFSDLIEIVSPTWGRVEIHVVPFGDYDFVERTYEAVAEMAKSDLSAVLVGTTPTHDPRVFVVVSRSSWERSRASLGDLEIALLFQMTLVIRRVFHGDDVDVATRALGEFLDGHSFSIRSTARLASSQYQLGGFAL